MMVFDTDDIKTLGDLAKLFEELKNRDVTRESALYVINKVWWEEN